MDEYLIFIFKTHLLRIFKKKCFVLELPQIPVITNLNGADLSSQAPIFHLGSLLNLSCEVSGGMYALS